MLSALSGKTHQVMTAIAFNRQQTMQSLIVTDVTFRELSLIQIRDYIQSEPMDKAGAYGIQGIGGVLYVKLMQLPWGCWFTTG